MERIFTKLSARSRARDGARILFLCTGCGEILLINSKHQNISITIILAWWPVNILGRIIDWFVRPVWPVWPISSIFYDCIALLLLFLWRARDRQSKSPNTSGVCNQFHPRERLQLANQKLLSEMNQLIVVWDIWQLACLHVIAFI